MNFLLAQIPSTTAAALGGWLVNAAAALAIVYLCLKLFFVIFPRRHPPLEEQFVSVKSFESQHAITDTRFQRMSDKIDRSQAELKADLHELRRELSERDADTAKTMSEVFRALGEVAGELRGKAQDREPVMIDEFIVVTILRTLDRVHGYKTPEAALLSQVNFKLPEPQSDERLKEHLRFAIDRGWVADQVTPYRSRVVWITDAGQIEKARHG